MSDDNKSVVDTTPKADAETLARLQKLEEENTKFKNEIKEIAGKRDELKGKLKEIEDKKLIDEGDTKKILGEREKELSELKTQFETVKKKADEFDSYKQTKREGLLAQIKDPDLKLVANEIQGLDKLETFVNKLNPTKIPDVDNGNAGGGTDLTDEQKADAKELGLSDKDYLAVMSHREKAKEKNKLKKD
jgi:seryl-tRNA synthetase